MRTPRDMLSIKLAAAQKRRQAALDRVAAEERTIAELQAKKRERYTRELRRKAHWPNRTNPAERKLAALLDGEGSRA